MRDIGNSIYKNYNLTNDVIAFGAVEEYYYYMKEFAGNTSDIVETFPQGPNPGDIVVLIYAQTSYNYVRDFNVAGYTKAGNLTYSDNYWGSMLIFYKIADGTETSLTIPGGTGSNSFPAVISVRYIKNATGTIESAAVITGVPNTTIPTSLSLTTTSNTSLVLFIGAGFADQPYIGPLVINGTNLNNVDAYYLNGAGYDTALAIASYIQSPGGTTPTVSFSSTATVNGATCSIKATIAFTGGVSSELKTVSDIWTFDDIYKYKLL